MPPPPGSTPPRRVPPRGTGSRQREAAAWAADGAGGHAGGWQGGVATRVGSSAGRPHEWPAAGRKMVAWVTGGAGEAQWPPWLGLAVRCRGEVPAATGTAGGTGAEQTAPGGACGVGEVADARRPCAGMGEVWPGAEGRLWHGGIEDMAGAGRKPREASGGLVVGPT